MEKESRNETENEKKITLKIKVLYLIYDEVECREKRGLSLSPGQTRRGKDSVKHKSTKGHENKICCHEELSLSRHSETLHDIERELATRQVWRAKKTFT